MLMGITLFLAFRLLRLPLFLGRVLGALAGWGKITGISIGGAEG